MKCVIETSTNEAKGKKVDFFGMLLGILGPNLLTNMLADKGVVFKISGQEVIKAGEGKIRAGQDF